MKITCSTRLGTGTDLLVDAHGTVELAVTLGPTVALGVERVQVPGFVDFWRIVAMAEGPEDEPARGIELHLGREEFEALLSEAAAAAYAA